MTVLRLRECSTDQQSGVADLYESAFPPAEREPFGSILAGDQTDELSVLVLLDDDGGVQALSVSSEISFPAIYLQYFAVDSSLRGKGIGTSFLTECLRTLRGQRNLGVVLEVERPASDPADAYRPRRIEFWRKGGAMLLLDRFVVPRLSGESGDIEMTLYWIPAAAADATLPDARHVAHLVLSEGYSLTEEVVAELFRRAGERDSGGNA